MIDDLLEQVEEELELGLGLGQLEILSTLLYAHRLA